MSLKRGRLASHGLLMFLSAVLLLVWWYRPMGAAQEAHRDLQAVWQRVQDSGVYHFDSNVVQTTTPNATVRHVGRESNQTWLHLQGQTNLPQESLHLTVWNGKGSVLQAESGVELKVEGGQAQARQGAQPWREIDDFTGIFAPGGDFTTYLSAAKNVVRHAAETRQTELGTITFTRYTFEVDGPGFARHMRDQMQHQMVAQGKMPASVQLEVPQMYVGMTGQGELWVGQDGLPIRQILQLAFPERSDKQQVTAEVTVSFSNFAPLPAAYTSSAPLDRLVVGLERMAQRLATPLNFFSFSLLPLGLGVVVLVIVRRRSEHLYGMVVVAVIVAMVTGPLLQSQQVLAFSTEQNAKQAAQEAQQAEIEQQAEAQAQIRQPRINPHIDPRTQAEARTALAPAAQATVALTPVSSSSSEYYAEECESSPNGHADQDGLTNLEECRLGTLPSLNDSDLDGANDNVEVAGFTWNGKTWYSDPTELDTNNDGITDEVEWETDLNNDGLPDDTDSDGTPDLWDLDNDGDGVPDDIDLSPYTSTKTTKTFTDASPFELIVDNLTAGQLTTVEFHLVPTNPDHLWYTYNVLDWPEDKQGQIQDGDNQSFYDVDTSLSAEPYDNGDVQLIPMLEIQITGSNTNLPSEDELNEYSISTQQLSADTKAVYVPVQLVTEDEGEKHVAFYAQMVYEPDLDWGNAQQVRLVWMVQVLNDSCEEYEDSICTVYSASNSKSIVQVYDDSWYLAGLHVREEHGTEVGLIYEDPAVDSDITAEEELYELAYALDQAFLSGRDLDNNGETDITVDEIYRRFNRTTNDTVSTTERWNLDDVFRVVKHSYGTSDLALQDTTVTQTISILDTQFTSHWTPANPITPTIMQVVSQDYRALNLDLGKSGSLVAWSGQRLTLNLSSSDQSTPILEETNHALSWAPYGYDAATQAWSVADIATYVAQLDSDLVNDVNESDPDVEEAYIYIAKNIYLSISQGLNSVVRRGNDVLEEATDISDAGIADDIFNAVDSGMGKLLKQFKEYLLDEDVLAWYKLVKGNPLSSLKSSIVAWTKQKFLSFSYETKKNVAGIAIGITIFALLVVIYLLVEYGSEIVGDTETVELAVSIIAFMLAVYDLFKTVWLIYNAVTKLPLIGTTAVRLGIVMTMGIEVLGTTKFLAAIGLAIAVAISLGFFIYLWASGKIEAGTYAFNMVVALTIASILIAIVFFIIALTVLGSVLTALFAVIDLILYFTIGFSVTAWLTEQLGKLIYTVDVSVEVDTEMGNMDATLQDEDKGYVEGNTITYSFPMTTTLKHDPPSRRPVLDFEQYTENGIKKNSMDYQLSTQTVSQSGFSTSSGDRYTDWSVSQYRLYDDYYPMYKAVATDNLAATLSLTAGINQTAYPLYLNSAYYLYGYDCWVFVCEKEIFEGSSGEEIGESLVLDIFPDTLDEFVAVGTWANTIAFKDADGDGLLASGFNGLDPNDAEWDTDGDGLSDAYELELRELSWEEGGELVDASLADTDGDGLSDATEIRLGINPANIDTDGDGLTDYQETEEGWTFTYGTNKSMRIYSDPASADVDGDGLDDLAEKTLHTCAGCDWSKNPYHPAVWNENPIGLTTSLSDEDLVVGRNQSFDYTTTAANNLTADFAARSEVNVTLPSGLSGAPLSALMDLQSGQSQDLVSRLTVSSSANSVTTSLVSSINAQLHTPSVWDWDSAARSSATIAKTGRGVALAPVKGWDVPYAAATLEQCGLTGSYYNNTSLSGSAVLTRCEGEWLDHEWSSGTPSSGVNSDSFSARWTGTFFFLAGSYTFKAKSDDGIRVWVDNVLIVDDWTTHSVRNYSATRTLTEGNHSIKVEYFEGTGGATMQFWWESNAPLGYGADASSSSILVYKATADSLSGSGVTVNDTSVAWLRTTPDIACIASGTCVVTWGERDPSSGSSRVMAAWVSSTPALSSRQTVVTLGSGQRVGDPSVATDGTNFMVAWREYGSSNLMKVRRLTSSGSFVSNAEQIVSSASVLDDVDLVWANSRYLAAWSDGSDIWTAFVSTTSGFYIPTVSLQTMQLDGTGQIVSTEGTEDGGDAGEALPAPSLVPPDVDEYTLTHATTAPAQLTSTAATTERMPTVGYDSVAGQALIVYRATEGSSHTLKARFLAGDDASAELSVATLSDTIYDAVVSAEPLNGGWVVAWSTMSTLSYQALAGDGTLRGSQQQITGDDAQPDVALVCRAPSPLVELNFEGNYTDDSGYGNNGSCTGSACPATNVSGWDGNAASFDGGDSLSLSMSPPNTNSTFSMWFKGTCQTCGLAKRTDLNQGLGLKNGNICASVKDSSNTQRQYCSSGTNYADGNWHQVTHVVGSSVSGNYLYLDGKLVASGTPYTACGSVSCTSGVTLGSSVSEGSFTGLLDKFQLYDRALSSSEVEDNYTSALAIYNLDEYAGGSSVTSFVNANGNTTYNASCSGSACPTTGATGKAYYAATFDGSSDYLKVAGTERTLATYSYDFESSVDSTVWSSTSRTSASRNGTNTYYLGNFNNNTINLNLTDLPTHDTIEIEFDLYVLGAWDGNRTDHGPDYWEWGYDNTKVLNTTFSNATSIVAGDYQAYPSEPGTPSGVTLYSGFNQTGDASTFTADDNNLSDNTIGDNRHSSTSWWSSTAFVLYLGFDYSDNSYAFDTYNGRSYEPSVPDNRTSSIRVWRAQNSPKTGANSGDIIGGSYPVYRITKTISNHSASSLSLYFDGTPNESTEYWGLDNVKVTVKSSSVPLKNSSFTLSAWAKRGSNGTDDYIISQGTSGSTNNGLHFGYRSTNHFTCAFWNNDLDTSTTYSDADVWHHWACTYDASTNTRTLYRDGVQVAQNTASADFGGQGALYIGSGLLTSSKYFHGTLDEVGIWTQALDAEDVYDLYSKTKILDESVTMCLLPRASDLTTLQMERLGLRQTTTDVGTSSQSVEQTITIDATAPTVSLTSLNAGEYLNSGGTLTIGGIASDSHSEVVTVEVKVDSGAWETATGGDSWSYNWNAGALAEGSHSVQARATDAAGNVQTSSTVSVILDRTAPTPATSLSANTLLTASRDAQGRWMVPLSGTVSDPNAGSSAGSGVKSIEVLLRGQDDISGNAWQTATLSGSSWSLNYILPRFNMEGEGLPTPSGVYTVTLRATDNGGNTTSATSYVTTPMRLDLSAPVAALTYPISTTTAITSAITLQGTVEDPSAAASGISGLEIAFTPAEEISLRHEASLHLPFDEPTNHRHFQDATGQGHSAGCPPQHCPAAGQPGKLQRAVGFDGTNDSLRVDHAGEFDLTNGTLMAWINPSWAPGSKPYNPTVLAVRDGSGVRYSLHINKNYSTMELWNGSTVKTVPVTMSPGQWYHIALVMNNGTWTGYLNGVAVGTPQVQAFSSTTGRPLHIGSSTGDNEFFQGLIDEVMILPRALSSNEVSVLYQAGSRPPAAVTLAQSGAGVTSTTWSYPLPSGSSGLEGIYQIDLIGVDALGNRTPIGKDQRAWRGEIDTRAPTLSVTASQSGAATPTDTRQTHYTCVAQDFSLDQSTSCRLVPTVPSSAAAFFPFDGLGTATSYTDYSGRNNNASCSGTTCPTAGETGRYGNALTFSGSQYLSIPMAVAPTQFALTAWIYPTSTDTGFHGFMGRDPGSTVQRAPSFYVFQQTRLHGGFGDGTNWNSFSTGSVLTTNAWNHVAMTFDSTTLRIYVNSSEVYSTTNYAGRTPYPITQYDIGRVDNYFQGRLDEVGLFESALSANDIAGLYQVTRTNPTFENTHLTLTYYNSLSTWYSSVFSNTLRLYQMSGARTYTGHDTLPVRLQACDLYGHCTAANSTTSMLKAETAVLTPTNGAIFTDLAPIEVTGAPNTALLTISQGGTPVHTQKQGEGETTAAGDWRFTWTPPSEGIYRLAAAEGSGIEPVTITVDLQPPAVSLDTATLTSADRSAEGELPVLRGRAADSVQVARVEVQINGGLWLPALLSGDSWRMALMPGLGHDGRPYTVNVRAIDLAGREAIISEQVVLDTTPPAPVTMTLGYTTVGGQVRPLLAGETLTDAASLAVSWTASSDGSGIAGYWAGWTTTAEVTTTQLTRYAGAGSHTQAIGEAQVWVCPPHDCGHPGQPTGADGRPRVCGCSHHPRLDR